MRTRLTAARLVLALAILASGAVVAAPAQAATPPLKPVVTMPPASLFHAQDPGATVRATGLSWGNSLTVRWGDGSNVPLFSTCSVAKARKQPAACADESEGYYEEPGTYTITVSWRKKVIARQAIVIKPDPKAWEEPEDWVDPAGWSVLGGGATFLPCATVEWFWDRTGEPGDRVRMHDNVQPALDMLAAETSLTFVETADPTAAEIVFRWSSDPGRFSDAAVAGVGRGGWNTSSGRVTLNALHWWTADGWRGFSNPAVVGDLQSIGNGWLIVHEVMHVLGMGHVDDPTQVMSPDGDATALGQGDLAGLHTMYKNQPCPA